MKIFTALALALISYSSLASASDLTVETFPTNTMITITGKSAQTIYNNLKVSEDTSGSDEQGAPKAKKLGASIFCTKQSTSRFVCVQYLDNATGASSND